MSSQPQLFRDEALEFRKSRLQGSVSVTHQVPLEITAVILVTLVLGAALLLISGRYDHTETVPGQIASSVGIAKVIVPNPGTVTDIRVRDGQSVAKGQVLATIHLNEATPSGADVAEERDKDLKAQRQDLEAEISADRDKMLTGVASYNAQIEQLRAEIAASERALRASDDLVGTDDAALARVTTAVGTGLVTKAVVDERRQNLLQAEQQRANLQQQIAELRDRILVAEQAMHAARSDFEQKRGELRSSLDEINVHGLEGSNLNYAIVAPISGRVTSMQAKVGTFADGHIPLLSIVEDASKLVATLYVPTKASGFVKNGQKVKLRVDAFPFEKFGSFEGRVVDVSHSILAPGEVDADVKLDQPVFPVTVALDQTRANFRDGTALHFQPGMTLVGDIVLEKRSFLDWLLEPLRSVTRR